MPCAGCPTKPAMSFRREIPVSKDVPVAVNEFLSTLMAVGALTISVENVAGIGVMQAVLESDRSGAV